jgi:Fibronectin type III domain/FG-GAP repeat
VSSVSDGNLSGRRLMQQNSTVYIGGYTAFEFPYGNTTNQQQAQNAADELYQKMASNSTLETVFQPAFPNSTITSDAVNRGELPVPQDSLPPPSSPSPSPSSPTPPSPSPSSPTPSPSFNTVPGGDGVTNDPPVSSPTPTPGGGGGGGSGGGGLPPVTAPSAPTNVVFTANTAIGGSADVSWTAPTVTGGAPITSFDLKCEDAASPQVLPPVSETVSATSAPPYVCSGATCTTTITGLIGGTYTCSVRATNSAGLFSEYATASANLVIASFWSAYPLGTGAVGGSGQYGSAVAVSSDGSTAVVGEYYASSGNGAAYVVKKTVAGLWGSPVLLTTGTGTENLAFSVAVNSDGSVIALGAPYSAPGGKVYLYSKISPSTPWTLSTTLAGSSGAFGYSVGVSNDGQTIVVGAPYESVSQGGPPQPNVGRIYIYSAPNWGSPTVEEGSAANDYFGYSVAISDGNTIVVGSYGYSSNRGNAYVLSKLGATWASRTSRALDQYATIAATEMFGTSVSVSTDGSVVIVGAPNALSAKGKVYVFTSGPPWISVVLGQGATANDNFGVAVSISSDANSAIVGAYGISNAAGAVYLYTKTAVTSWDLQPYILATGVVASDNLGWSVSVSSNGKDVVAGAIGVASYVGAAYGYIYT